jgi:hypothetical protein
MKVYKTIVKASSLIALTDADNLGTPYTGFVLNAPVLVLFQ